MDIDFQSLGVAETIGRTLHLELLAHPMCNRHAHSGASLCEVAKHADWQVLRLSALAACLLANLKTNLSSL
jgi:hypothetical protein